jgi:hypothetical protein
MSNPEREAHSSDSSESYTPGKPDLGSREDVVSLRGVAISVGVQISFPLKFAVCGV